MTHTPGPWEKKHSKRLGWAVVYPGISLLAKAGAIVVVCDTMNEEDATLIAAAPDLLAACDEAVQALMLLSPDCLDNVDFSLSRDELINKIFSAIVRARPE